VGISASVRDVYGRYNDYGELERSAKNLTSTLSFGAATRLGANMEAFLVIPMIFQETAYGERLGTRSSIGDIVLGSKWTILESLFADDWYPTAALLYGIKFPTGSLETRNPAGQIIPGTGNGIWEPYLGLDLKKRLGRFTFAIGGSYTFKWQVEIAESATFHASRRLGLALGSSQLWAFSSQRVVTAFISGTYFPNPFLSVGLTFDSAIPIERFGANQQAARTIIATMKYAFF